MNMSLAPGIILYGKYPSTSNAYLMLSDHSRSDISISNEIYQKSVQMANGDTRKYVISNKRTIQLSWTDLPSNSFATADNGAGGKDLKLFYENNYNSTVTLYAFIDLATGSPLSTGMSITPTSDGMLASPPDALSSAMSMNVYIEDFSFNVKKRYPGGGTAETGYYDLWDINMSLKQV